MSKAFLSHSSHDKKLVEPIGRALGKNSVHLDSLTFEAGQKTIEEIFSGLSDTDIFVLFISEKGLESEWVKKEITHAKKLIDKNIIARIYPLIIDKEISYTDPRIPDWIKKPYNIKHFDNEVIILQKIRQLLRESNFKKYSNIRDLSDLVVGRYNLFKEFDQKINTIDNIVPSCIIAYSIFEGIGRRTFLKTALIRNGIIEKWYEPLFIPFDSKQSIEDFIYKLNFIEKNNEIFEYDFSQVELPAKVKIAGDLVRKFASNNVLIFLVDDGGIVLPNTKIAPWFLAIMENPDFGNQVAICIASKFKPKQILLRQLQNVIAFQIDELPQPEVQTFFVRYLKQLGIEILPEDSRFFLNHLHGIPAQVIYAGNLIASLGVQDAKNYFRDIDEFDELNVATILKLIKNDELTLQILIALSKFEFISYQILYSIFGENDDVYKAIQHIFDLGLFYNVSTTHEYVKLNSSLSDYINRSGLTLNHKYNLKLKELVGSFLQTDLRLDAESDYSAFLITLQNLIKNKQKIPERYFLPSFILKAIVAEYYDHHYEVVISLAKKILENDLKFDPQIIRETRYWLCLAYCWKGYPSFFDEVRFFKDEDQYNLKDYYFLLGFYFRLSDDMDRAEQYFVDALAIDENHSKTKRELVNVYLRKREFGKALKLARENHEKYPNNIFHINAYFTCLVNQPNLQDDDLGTIKDLLEIAKESLDKRATNFYSIMNCMYIYFVQKDMAKAIRDLRNLLRLNKDDFHAFKALSEILRREELEKDREQLNRDFPKLYKHIE